MSTAPDAMTETESKTPASRRGTGVLGNVQVQARVPEALVAQAHQVIRDQPVAPGETFSDFMRAALEAEVSRRTVCRPVRETSLGDLADELLRIKTLINSRDLQTRANASNMDLIQAQIALICQAVGVPAQVSGVQKS